MILRLFIVIALVFSAAACGTKDELALPNGKENPKHDKDPSQPTNPIGR